MAMHWHGVGVVSQLIPSVLTTIILAVSTCLLFYIQPQETGAVTMSGLPFNKGEGAWHGGNPEKVNVIVVHAGFGDATLLEVSDDKGKQTTHCSYIS